jgi:hypothetical protein
MSWLDSLAPGLVQADPGAAFTAITQIGTEVTRRRRGAGRARGWPRRARGGPFRDLRVTATMLVVLGLVIGIADHLAARDETGGRHRAPEQRFVWYRVALGIVIIALVSAGLLSPRAAESAS